MFDQESTMVTDGGWKPQRSLDARSRRAKAAKIAALIEKRRPLAGADLLEIGTGAGIIATLLAEEVGPAGRVVSVDVDDLRTVHEGYEFHLVDGVELPFPDESFDVVVSNHTIEHVGAEDEQLTHLREIARVLRPDGVGYLASPTRWALVEPHFKVPLLSWLPPAQRTPVLRLTGRGRVYDINPRTRAGMLSLIERAGLRATDVTLEALRTTADIEQSRVARTAAALPDGALSAVRGALPTMVFLIAK
ncbi:MAG: class I SAM-dependent methyltransferase [Thermoanaerobacterales bacterium]|nr:class I SAM-dependent methyltransferase [Thermoanaerobacterales bacterium]